MAYRQCTRQYRELSVALSLTRPDPLSRGAREGSGNETRSSYTVRAIHTRGYARA